MRNALVLVPLCIGLTSGFIVPTSTSEVKSITQSITTLKQEKHGIDTYEINENSTDSINSDNYLNNTKDDDAQQQLYIESPGKNKTIEERSFVLVNQRWNKQPLRIHLADSVLPNSGANSKTLKKTSYLNVFQEGPRKNVIPLTGMVHTKPFNNRQNYIEYDKQRDKSYSTTTNRIESKIHSKHGFNSIHDTENKITDNQNILIELLKPSLIRPPIRKYENVILDESMKNNYVNSTNKKHFMEFSKDTHNIEAYSNEREKVNVGRRKWHENVPLYNDKIQNQINKSYVEPITDHKSFHVLLEDQAPYKQAIYKHSNSSLASYKYCRKCALLAKMTHSSMDKECDCICGRYIHLKGPMEPEN